MSPRRERADAQRNREAVLAAADRLFAASTSPGGVSMDDVATAAGVGKGTLFRRFGDRDGLIQALMEKRIAPLREAVAEGPAPLGPDTPARERVPALMAALLRFKLDNRHLALALETGGGNSPYRAGHYTWWHTLLRDAVRGIPGAPDADFTAHALLAAVRADLVEHLAGGEGAPPERLEERLEAYVAKVLA
ncbi:TetR/AcrR family transcriptional regulator [Nocardiopsis sp. NPDC006198]|uniref:TetR/AcrR family transcriptional regulator n=1 Tax=Streptomonospora nanhaiensis TaxID=1323731 RepID=A0ABY6YL74_9ACTN|nr:TetR/AcrR family transcriptional regulator [Streptomonospora nanhaiensis]WAE72963.1 TetR/AcrR family transcriptional regulator [Streptomonospora nanhaiensis]